MLDKLRITAKNSIVYSLGNFATKLVGLFLLPLYTSEFSIEEYGVIGLLEVTIRILVALFGLNLFNAFFRWYWDKDLANKRRSLFFTVLFSVSIISVFLTFSFLFFGESLASILLKDTKFTFIFRLAIISAALETICVVPFTLLRLQSKAGQYTITSLIRLLVNVGMNILLIVFLNKGIESIYYASIAGSGVFLLVLLPYILKNIDLRFETQILKSMLNYSLPLLLSSVTGIILGITDRYVLQIITGLEQVGIYSLGFKLANTIRFLIIVPINMAVLPLFYKIIGEPESKRFYARFTTYYAYLVGIAVLGMSLFSEIVVKLFARDPEYWDSYIIVPFLAFGVLFGMLKDMALTGLHIKRNTGKIATITIAVAVLNIILNALLIPHFKSVGAAIATLVVQFLFFAVVLYVAQKQYPIPFEVKRLAILVINIILLVMAGQLLKDFGLGIRIAGQAVLILIYPFSLFLFRFYEDREFTGIIGFFKKWKNPGNWKSELMKFAKLKEDE